ncbi:MAG: hypothetical protein U9Q70_07850 [Chloroflexota bacterium]|nr:hypothetical protein [Chloroflexota bacterium]
MLRAVLWCHACPVPERLGLYQLRLLPAEEQLLLAQHVQACPYCQRELRELAAEETQPSLLQRWCAALDVLPARLAPVALAAGVGSALSSVSTAGLAVSCWKVGWLAKSGVGGNLNLWWNPIKGNVLGRKNSG